MPAPRDPALEIVEHAPASRCGWGWPTAPWPGARGGGILPDRPAADCAVSKASRKRCVPAEVRRRDFRAAEIFRRCVARPAPGLNGRPGPFTLRLLAPRQGPRRSARGRRPAQCARQARRRAGARRHRRGGGIVLLTSRVSVEMVQKAAVLAARCWSLSPRRPRWRCAPRTCRHDPDRDRARRRLRGLHSSPAHQRDSETRFKKPLMSSHDNKLVYMANQIGLFFARQNEEQAVAGTNDT